MRFKRKIVYQLDLSFVFTLKKSLQWPSKSTAQQSSAQSMSYTGLHLGLKHRLCSTKST